MVFNSKEYKKIYSQSRQTYGENKTEALQTFQAEPNIIDIILEPLRPQIFKKNGKLNIWWIIWNVGKIIGRIVAAIDERTAEKKRVKQAIDFAPTYKRFADANEERFQEWVNNGFQSSDLYKLEKERLKWSLETFTESTPLSSLLKLESEVREIKWDLKLGKRNPEDYADALMCLLDSAGRQEIYLEEILVSYEKKIKVNKSRKWIKNPDNSYSHIKGT